MDFGVKLKVSLFSILSLSLLAPPSLLHSLPFSFPSLYFTHSLVSEHRDQIFVFVYVTCVELHRSHRAVELFTQCI